jgi:glycosyltransferase involved in cell wall biosynthesis
MRITIIIPAYNEEATIKQTLLDFHAACPQATLCVVDNNSTDRTSEVTMEAYSAFPESHHILLKESRKGKSNAMRTAFMQIESDVYVMVDADSTYSGRDLFSLMDVFIKDNADMVVGDRHSSGDYSEKNTRNLHGFGNNLVKKMINILFHTNLHDILSGYRVFSRRYVKSFPILSTGFELETEMTLHALTSRLLIREIPVSYRERPPMSFSKLNTFSDGIKVVFTIFNILRYARPLFFFGIISLLVFVLGIVSGSLPVFEFFETGKILHFPLAILASALIICSFVSFSIAVILDMLAHLNKKTNELRLISLSGNTLKNGEKES